jgi:hypothetical protein
MLPEQPLFGADARPKRHEQRCGQNHAHAGAERQRPSMGRQQQSQVSGVAGQAVDPVYEEIHHSVRRETSWRPGYIFLAYAMMPILVM